MYFQDPFPKKNISFETFLEELVVSIQAQTYQDFKVYFGIDGDQLSRRWFIDMVKWSSILAGQTKIMYFHENQGAYRMRNTLVRESDEPGIVFFDADDVMYPNYLEDIISWVEKEKTRYHIPLASMENGQTRAPEGSFFIDRQLMKQVGGFPSVRLGGDTFFKRMLYNNGISPTIGKEPTYYYSSNEHSLTGRFPWDSPERKVVRQMIQSYSPVVKYWKPEYNTSRYDLLDPITLYSPVGGHTNLN